MQLWIVRHGQTEANVQGIIQGQQGGKLTQRGINEAKALGPRLCVENFKEIYCSDLARTRETLENILSSHTNKKSLKITYSSLLREKSGGVLEGKPLKTFKENAQKANLSLRQYKPESGESWENVMGRAKQFLNQVMEVYVNPELEKRNQGLTQSGTSSIESIQVIPTQNKSLGEQKNTSIQDVADEEIKIENPNSSDIPAQESPTNKPRANDKPSLMKTLLYQSGDEIYNIKNSQNTKPNSKINLTSKAQKPSMGTKIKQKSPKSLISDLSVIGQNQQPKQSSRINKQEVKSVPNLSSKNPIPDKKSLQNNIKKTPQPPKMNVAQLESLSVNKHYYSNSDAKDNLPKILIVTHGGWIMEFFNEFNQRKSNANPVYCNDIRNCSLNIVQIYPKLKKKADSQKIFEPSYSTIVKNDVEHLI